MAGKFSELMERGKAAWSRITLMHRVFLVAFSAVVCAVFIGMVIWINQPDYRLLLGNLPPEDANRVVQMLVEEKVAYRLEENGTSVLVPADKVYDLRLKVAGSNTIQGAGQGFEIFDTIQVGETDFVQKMKYQRALQGELSRTIGQFPGVESARVHLVLPHKSLFIEEQQSPSASVVLKMQAGSRFESKDIEPVVNLLVMSVEGLDKNHVSVSDSSGKVLYFPDEDSLTGLSTTQLEHKATVQTMLERRIEEMLSPVIGPGKVIARVNADLDFSQKTRRLELFDPEKTVLRSTSRSESATRGQSTLDAQSPDANFRADSTGGLSEQESTSENRFENYEINKEEQNIISPVGEISRLSVAVIVDGTYAQNEAGETVFTPRNQEELDRIQQLIVNAVGYDSARGDSIEVTSIAFGSEELDVEPQLSDMIMDYVTRLGKPMLNTILVLLFLLLVVRPVVLAMIRPRVQNTEVMEGLEGLPAGENRLALLEGEDEIDVTVDALKQIEDIKNHALSMVEQNMDQAVSILRGWINAGGTSVGQRAA